MIDDEWRAAADAELNGEPMYDDDGAPHPGAGRTVIEGTEPDAPRRAAGLPWMTPGADWLTDTPPPRDYLLHASGDAVSLGNGLLPRGKVAILAAAGGAGKTFALCGLALALVTGRPWLGCFPVGPGVLRRVVLVLGEEEPAELRRRLWTQARAMGLEARHADAVGRILALPGAGLDNLALTRAELADTRARTPFADALFAHLAAAAAANGEGWDAVILDPLSRFAGPDVETDNSAATRLVQVLERLCELPGRPSVVVAHHTTKASRGADGEGASTTAVRGASGLTDGARWVAGLDPVDPIEGANLPPLARFRVTKNNYGAFPKLPDGGALLLARADGGGLRAVTDAERDRYTRARERDKADKAAKRAAKAAAPSTTPKAPTDDLA